MGDTNEIPRPELTYTPKYQRFLLRERVYTRQYSHVYTKRLSQLRFHVKRNAERIWPALKSGELQWCKKVIDLREGQERVVIGTLYKDMALKPNVLDEFASDSAVGLAPLIPKNNYCSDSDSLIIEDHSGRALVVAQQLDGETEVVPTCWAHSLVTGIVVAIRGYVTSDGALYTTGISFAGLPDQAQSPFYRSLGQPSDPKLLLFSGIYASGAESSLSLHLLADYARGLAGGSVDTQEASSVARIIVAGGLVDKKSGSAANEAFGDRSMTAAEQEALATPMKEADLMLSLFATAGFVDVMPGEYDPSNQTLPQQRLHPCLFPLSSQYNSFRTVTNPYEFEIGGTLVLGTSGQNLNDAIRYMLHAVPTPGYVGTKDVLSSSNAKHPIDSPASRVAVLANMLFWRHIAPTAPDTLAAYPFYEKDPFTITSCPHIAFAGCQPAYASALMTETELRFDSYTHQHNNENATRLEKSFKQIATGISSTDAERATRIICVPDFASTHTAVLVNLRTLETAPIQFQRPAGTK